MRENGADTQVVASVEADDWQPRWPPQVRSTVDQLSYAGGIFEDAHNLFLVTASGAQEVQLT